MQKYSEYRPTKYDVRGLGCADRQDWLVCPVVRTRDSGPLSQSNFEVLLGGLQKIDPGEECHEVCRFGHWGPGWYEIILVKPETGCEVVARQAEEKLEDSAYLSEDHYSEMEREAYQSAWESWGAHEFVQQLESFGAVRRVGG